MYDIIEPAAMGTDRCPRSLKDYEAVILGDVSSMDDNQVALVDAYVQQGGKVLITGFTATKDAAGKPLNSLQLQAPGVEPIFELFKKAKSTYLKIAAEDKTALGQKAFSQFSIMMMYSDFMKCKPRSNARVYMKLLPETRFGPPEKSYYTAENITDYPGVIANEYGRGKSVLIPWSLGEQYRLKGHYMHRALFVASLESLLGVPRDLKTDASPLIEITHIGNRNNAFEWIGMINHSGQLGGSLREPIPVYNTHIKFKTARLVKQVKLLRSGKTLNFKQQNGWLQCTVPSVEDFEMLLCLY